MENIKEPARYSTINTDLEVPSLDEDMGADSPELSSPRANLKFLVAGIFFGLLLIKSEVASWFRIQEMFRLQSFHMYGVMGSAVLVGALSVFLIKKFNIKTVDGDPIGLHKKKFSKGHVYGGLLFGFGWALTGACPGPVYALIGNGLTVFIVTWLCAVAGTWTYGLIRQKLPH